MKKGKKICKALQIAVNYGGVDDARHKAWVIDQMVRALAGAAYTEVVRRAREGEEGPETYDWDIGTAP
jgi:hypothetical protein